MTMLCLMTIGTAHLSWISAKQTGCSNKVALILKGAYQRLLDNCEIGAADENRDGGLSRQYFRVHGSAILLAGVSDPGLLHEFVCGNWSRTPKYIGHAD